MDAKDAPTMIEVGQIWAATPGGPRRKVVRIENGLAVFDHGSVVSFHMLRSEWRLIERADGTRPGDDRPPQEAGGLWIDDAALERLTLAADMLTELGYVFAGNHWTAPTPNPLTAKPASSVALLNRAAAIQSERAVNYDRPGGERSMAATVVAFNAQTGRDLTEDEGWLLMVNLKIVRDRAVKAGHVDSCEDLVSYSALYGESRLSNNH